MHEHIVFFDAECSLCHQAVRRIIEIDRSKRIVFAPLKGETADRILSGPLEPFRRMNSLVLIENYTSTARKFWVRSRAVLRVHWLVGEGWKIVGWLSYLPGWLGDFFYAMVAEHRHQFKLKPMKEIGPKDRFLP